MVKPGEGLGPDTLTVNERVLLHLRESTGPREATDAFATTQPGIAGALGIRVNHVSRAVKQLVRDGLVVEGTARIGGEVRRRKVYAITPEGHAIAHRLAGEVAHRRILAVDADGARTMAATDARRLVTPPTLTRILAIVDGEGRVDLRRQASGRAREPPKVAEGRPAPKALVGRDRETATFRAWLEDGPPVLAVTGPRGIGKTALATLCVDDSRPIFWWSVRPSDAPAPFLAALATFLADLGKVGLRRSASAGTPDPREVARILARDLRGTHAILVLDDVHETSPAFAPYVDAAIESAAAAGVRVAATSEGPLPRRAALRAEGLLDGLALKGLDRKAARTLLPREVDDAEFAKMYGLTQGNPLSLKLLATEPVPDEYTPEERALLKVLRMRQDEG